MTASPRVRMSWAPRPCPNSAPGPGGWSCRTAQSRRLRCREGAPSRRPQVRLLPGAPSDTALASPQEAKLTDAAPERLWAPSPARIESAGITRYRRWLERERGLRFDGYDALWRWSVGELAATLTRLGVRSGDRVAAYLPNVPESVVAMLASASLGAVWSSAAPDMGPPGVVDRFRQIEPKVLFAVDGYRYGGKAFDRRETVREIVRELPSVEAVVMVPHLDPGASIDVPGTPRAIAFIEAIATPAPLAFTP